MSGRARGEMGSICFLCSPSLGILDNWLPVLSRVRRLSPESRFICVLPQAKSAEQIDPENVLFRIAADLFEKIYVRTHSGIWLEAESFDAARRVATSGRVRGRLLALANRLARVPVAKLVAKVFFFGFRKIDEARHSSRRVEIESALRSVGAVAYDVYEETKAYNLELIHALRGVPRFSMCHGIDINQDPIVQRYSGAREEGEVLAYLFSEQEKRYYKGSYGLGERDLKVVGVPRHEKEWLKMIERLSDQGDPLPWDDYIFVISRPTSRYLPVDRKRKALRDIRRLAFDQLGKRIVVKHHPKEKATGIFDEIFGTESYGSRWRYSNHHPFVIAGRCLFAVTFFSGVAVDMLALGIPVIEYLNLRGIPRYDHERSLRDAAGEPVLSYRYLGIVLGASDAEQLELHAQRILADRAAVVDEQAATYRSFFGPPANQDPSTIMAGDILSGLESRIAEGGP